MISKLVKRTFALAKGSMGTTFGNILISTLPNSFPFQSPNLTLPNLTETSAIKTESLPIFIKMKVPISTLL